MAHLYETASESPRRAQVDAVLDRDGTPIAGEASGRDAEFGTTSRASGGIWGSIPRGRILVTTGLPWPFKFLLTLLIPAILIAGVALMGFFVVGLGILRLLGSVLALFGFRAPRRAHRDPMDLIRWR